MAKQLTPKTKKEFKLKPCNDPSRDDWSVLSKLLRRTESPEGLTEVQAKAKLEGLLIEAYAKNCDQMVTAACHSRSKATGNKSYLQTIFDALGRNPARRLDFYETIRTRLLLPEDGRDRPISKANQKAEKGSSYRMLEYWEADKMGILPYVRVRVTHIINGMKEEIEGRNRKVSLETLAATNTGLQLDADGMGRIVRQKSADIEVEDVDLQELHDGDVDLTANSRFATPEDGEAEGLEDIVGEGGGSEKAARLNPEHKGVKMLSRLLDSMLSDQSVNNSPLFDDSFVETLAENEVTLGSFKELVPLMAEVGQPENADELNARVAAELAVAREMVSNLGGIRRIPEDVAVRMTEALRELDPDDEGATDEGATERDPSDEEASEHAPSATDKIGQTNDQRLSFAFSQNRKQLTAFAKASRPEFELFSLILGERIMPGESPEARYAQLRESAKRIAAEKCQGMNSPEDVAVGITIESSVEEWDPAVSGFGRRFPDVLDHLETEAARALEEKTAAAIAAAQARIAAKAAEPEVPLAATVQPDGQMDFMLAMAAKTGSPAAAITVLKESAAEEPRRRVMADTYRDVKTIEEIIRTPEMQEAFAVRNALETGFWISVCRDPEELSSPERVDYKFLCSKLGLREDYDLADEALHAEVKAMAVTWVDKLVRAREEAARLSGRLNLASNGDKPALEVQFNRDLVAATAAYDPAEDGFFSQALNEFLKEQLVADQLRRKRGPRTPAVAAEESVAMHVVAPPAHAEVVAAAAPSPRKDGKDSYAD